MFLSLSNISESTVLFCIPDEVLEWNTLPLVNDLSITPLRTVPNAMYSLHTAAQNTCALMSDWVISMPFGAGMSRSMLYGDIFFPS